MDLWGYTYTNQSHLNANLTSPSGHREIMGEREREREGGSKYSFTLHSGLPRRNYSFSGILIKIKLYFI